MAADLGAVAAFCTYLLGREPKVAEPLQPPVQEDVAPDTLACGFDLLALYLDCGCRSIRQPTGTGRARLRGCEALRRPNRY